MMTDPERRPAVHDQVLVEGEIDGKVVGLRAVIVNVMPSILWLGLSRPDPRLERLQPNQPIHLTFRQGRAAMVAASTFINHLGAGRTRFFSIEWPTDFNMVQRRAYLRMDADCRVDYTVLNHGAGGGAGRIGHGMTRNISAGGMQFILDEGEAGLGEGDQLDLRIHLSATSWVLAEGEVLRLDEVAEPVPVEKAWLATSGKPAGKPAPIGRAGVAGKPGPAARAGSVGRPVSAAKVVPPAGAAAADEPLPATKMITLIAVRFVSIPEAAQDRIVRHIFALQRMRRDRARRLG